MTIDIETIRRVSLARHLHELARECLRSANDLHLFSGVNLLQDAIEAFLVAVADSTGAALDERTNFDKYFSLINEKINPKELPFKNNLLRLNKLRVSSKHHGIQPARDEAQRLSIITREFFDEVSSSILGVNFATVSAIDLLREGETKELLLAAKTALESKDYPSCSINCRKAIFLEIEKSYSIADFHEDAKPRGLLRRLSKAPLFAKNKEYIRDNVKEPTDYIVYDHSDLDQELLKYSIDNTAFWNIWRLTPKVYQDQNKNWAIKNELAKLDAEFLSNTAEYIFNTTTDIIIAIHTKKNSIKSQSYRSYHIELSKEEVPVYDKADKNSKILHTTPKGMKKIDCDFHVTGLNGEGHYWYVRDFGEDDYLSGFIHDEHVKRNNQ